MLICRVNVLYSFFIKIDTSFFIDYTVPKTEAGIRKCQLFCAKDPKCNAFTFSFARFSKYSCSIKSKTCKKIRPSAVKYTYQKIIKNSKSSLTFTLKNKVSLFFLEFIIYNNVFNPGKFFSLYSIMHAIANSLS